MRDSAINPGQQSYKTGKLAISDLLRNGPAQIRSKQNVFEDGRLKSDENGGHGCHADRPVWSSIMLSLAGERPPRSHTLCQSRVGAVSGRGMVWW
jgi:hypothetical protein